MLKEHGAEALTGLAVLVVAVWFLVFTMGRTGNSGGARYALSASFPNASGLAVGSDVRVSGLKVGTVTAQKLDPQSYQAVLSFSVDANVRLPLDSSAAITSDGLLGGSYLALIPGGDSEMLAPGDEITDTQGSTDLMGLIGSLINRSGDNKGADAGPAGKSGGAG